MPEPNGLGQKPPYVCGHYLLPLTQEAYKNIYSAIKECLEVIHEFHRELPKETIKPDAIKKLSFVKIPYYVKA